MSAEISGHSDNCHCHYLPHLIAVRPEQKQAAIEGSGGRELENGEACRILDGLTHDIVEDILEVVGVIHIDAEDPHALVAELNSNDIGASPIHGVGFLGHGGFQGSDWTHVAGTMIPNPGSAEKGVIAVVDSGIVPDEDLPDWMKGDNVLCERPLDTDTLPHKHPVGHGTFVTSLIRRMAPTCAVSIASARPDPGYTDSTEPNHEPGAAPAPTDELNVLGAVLRLLRRHKDDSGELRALNLSLGVHACPGDDFERFVTIRRACELWKDRFGDQAPIFAAAGNSLCPKPIYPAGFSHDDGFDGLIHGVAAAKENAKGGIIKVWDNGAEVDAPNRDWVTDAAPGCDVVGLSGQDPDQVVQWSGSSHATAVLSASTCADLTSDSDDIRWWPDRAVTYRDVPNLIP